jgi:hypothetical protein
LGEWKSAVDYTRVENLEKLYLTDGAGLARLVEGVRPVTDEHPYTEFPLWRQLFVSHGGQPFEAHVARERLNRLARK